MIPFLEDAIRDVQRLWESPLLQRDIWRVKHQWFGPFHAATQPGGTVLLVGAGSGLEVALCARKNPNHRIFVLDPDESTTRLKFLSPQVEVVHKIDDLAIHFGLEALTSFCRIDLDYFDWFIADPSIDSFRFGYVCGEFDPATSDPLSVHRRFRTQADLFCLVQRGGGRLTDGGDLYDFEVSVIVPAYGVEAFLPACLTALAEQSIKSLQIIVVIDGSPDRCGAIADEFAARFPDRFVVIHKQNGGCASARMEGLKHARGEFVGFVDGDDWVLPTMYETLYRTAKTYQAEVAQCGFFRSYNDGTRVITSPCRIDVPGHPRVGAAPSDLIPLMQPSIWRRIYHRDFLGREKPEFPVHIRRFDDLPFEFVAMATAKSVAVVPDPLYAYRCGRPGQDTEIADRRLLVHFDIFDWLRKKIAPFTTAALEDRLARVERATHKWALSRLRGTDRFVYLAALLRDRLKLFL